METTKQKIVKYVKERGSVSAKDLVEYTCISKQALFLHLKYLVENNLLTKIGTPPRVFYIINEDKKDNFNITFSEDIKKVINENFLFITSIGKIKEGIEGFVSWCSSNNLEPNKTAKEYVNTLKKYDKYRLKSGLIDGTQKIKDSFDKIFLNKIFYLDFYSIERFGKTKLGKLLLYSKQSQDKKLIKSLSLWVKDRILSLIKEYNIDAVCFIPPTVKRETQFMKELEKNLNLGLKKIKVVKIKLDIAVPQKTLNKIEDRVKNAASTFFVNDKGFYGNILIIDDAVGSGSTLNIMAKKIKQAKINKGKIIGIAITGSYKGFDVISEV